MIFSSIWFPKVDIEAHTAGSVILADKSLELDSCGSLLVRSFLASSYSEYLPCLPHLQLELNRCCSHCSNLER